MARTDPDVAALGSSLPAGAVDTILDHLPDVTVLTIDNDLRYRSAGGSGLGLAGWDPSQLLGRTVEEVLPPEAAAPLAARYRAALDGEPQHFRHPGARRPDRLHEVDVLPLRSLDGAVTGAIIVARDVTDELSTIEALRHNEERLRNLADLSADMQALYDAEGNYLEVSRASLALFGWEPEELIGTSSYDHFPPEDLARVREAHDVVLDGPDLATVSYRLRCKDGSFRWVEVNGRSITDPSSGAITAIQCTTRDITRRRELERELRESEARFRTAMKHAPIGMALLDLAGRMLDANAALCTILEREPDDLQGASLLELNDPADRAGLEAARDELIADQRATFFVETRFLRPDGSAVECSVHMAVLRDDHGAPSLLIAQIKDISERLAATQALRAANEELSLANAELARFAAVASHDLRSPLATARGLLDMLAARVTDSVGDVEVELLDRARGQLEHLVETVDGILALTRASSTDLVMESLATVELVAEVLEGLGDAVDPATTTIEFGSLDPIVGDRRLLRVLLQNLVANAVLYLAPERPLVLRIASEAGSDGWQLHVEDNGRGVPEALRQSLFEPFARGDHGEHIPGSGIGLATCRRIAERHGGVLEATHLEPGTRFTLRVSGGG
jgi:PAS domain S-box-containing protein